jgi:hypothetical protein
MRFPDGSGHAFRPAWASSFGGTWATRLSPTSEVEAALGADFAGGFSELQAEYAATPTCAQAAYRNTEAMCGVAVPLFDHCLPGEDISVDVDVVCEGDDVLGPRDGEIWTYRTLDIENAGTYYVLAVAGMKAQADGIELERCEGGCGSPPILVDIDDAVVEEPVDEVRFRSKSSSRPADTSSGSRDRRRSLPRCRSSSGARAASSA